MPVPVPSSSVSIFICFVPVDLLGNSWAVTEPALYYTPALCVLPAVHPSGDTAHLAPCGFFVPQHRALPEAPASGECPLEHLAQPFVKLLPIS